MAKHRDGTIQQILDRHYAACRETNERVALTEKHNILHSDPTWRAAVRRGPIRLAFADRLLLRQAQKERNAAHKADYDRTHPDE